ncbi:MAG: T9SS type A sorting domain-containing protein [Candidatus Eisenbacteria bacterium]
MPRPADHLWRHLLTLLVLTCAPFNPVRAIEVADPRAWTTDGMVFGMQIRDQELYLGGAFNYLGPVTGGLVGVDGASEDIDRDWPQVEGAVNAIIPDGQGGWYIGGSFLRVGGLRRSHLAHFRSDRTMDDWAPVADKPVLTMQLVGERVYLGGEFTRIGGVDRMHLAAVDRTTGAVQPWAPVVAGSVFTLSATHDQLVVGGEFSRIDGKVRYSLASFDRVSGELSDWAPELREVVLRNTAQVYILKVSGDRLFVGGRFVSVDGVARAHVCAFMQGSAELSEWAPQIPYAVRAIAVGGPGVILGGEEIPALDRPRFEVTAVDSLLGDTILYRVPAELGVLALSIQGSAVLVGGSFYQMAGSPRLRAAALELSTGALLPWSPSFGGPIVAWGESAYGTLAGGTFQSAGGVARRNLGALSLATFAATPWAPEADLGVISLLVDDQHVYAGGNFSTAGGRPREHIAQLDRITGAATAWNPGIQGKRDYANVHALALANGTLYAGGDFAWAGGLPRIAVAAIDAVTGAVLPWDPALRYQLDPLAHAIVVHDSTVYLGGQFNEAGGAARPNLAALDIRTARARDWNPAPDWTVNALLWDSGQLFVGGGFWTLGGAARMSLGAVDAVTGVATAWAPGIHDSSGLSSVMALQLEGGELHAGGNFALQNGVARQNVVRLGTADAVPTPWNARMDYYLYVHALAPDAGADWVGGLFVQAAGRPATGLARVVTDAAPPVGLSLVKPDEPIVVGEPYELHWYASDDLMVQGVDIRLSRSGPTGPWETIALACPNTGRYRWMAEGPVSDDALLRFEVRDFAQHTTTVEQAGLRIALTRAPAVTTTHLSRPLPNPMVDQTDVRFSLANAGPIRLTLLDAQGRVVRTLVDEHRLAGAQNIRFARRGLNPGLYWLRLETAGTHTSRRLVVL